MRKECNLFDLHCDTALRLAAKSLSLTDSDCHISLKKAEYLKKYAQVFAVFTPRSLSDDEGFKNFKKTVDYFEKEIQKNADCISLCRSSNEIKNALESNKRAAILAVEDVRIIGEDESRIDFICSKGVRFVTPVWGGESCIGGAHNTDIGLTAFGKTAVRRLAEKNVVLDISHASEKTADDIISEASAVKGKVIATHSNSASVYNHTRNLRDRHFRDIKSMGGLVGISLCPPHISDEKEPNVDSVVRHIDRYMELGGEDIVAIGADLDGTDLPIGFGGVQDIYKIADRLSELGYSEKLIGKIFYENALSFTLKNL